MSSSPFVRSQFEISNLCRGRSWEWFLWMLMITRLHKNVIPKHQVQVTDT